MIELANGAFVSKFADIEDSVRGSLITIGENSMIDSFVKFKAAGGNGNIIIGANVHINANCVLYIGNGIVIGDNTAIGAGTLFAPVNHNYSKRNKLIKEQRFKQSKGGVKIGKDCWIGAGCVLLDGTTIEDGAVVGAMSLVRERVPAYSIGYGNPFKIVNYRK